eukprot:scaffold145455_cov21-Tisochrysis_lutea.AAC.1
MAVTDTVSAMREGGREKGNRPIGIWKNAQLVTFGSADSYPFSPISPSTRDLGPGITHSTVSNRTSPS